MFRPTPRRRPARGVYRLPYLSKQGYTQLVAIDHRGREVSRAFVFRGESEVDVAAVLEGVLDETDPAVDPAT